jgi:hypothetical protein
MIGKESCPDPCKCCSFHPCWRTHFQCGETAFERHDLRRLIESIVLGHVGHVLASPACSGRYKPGVNICGVRYAGMRSGVHGID